MAATGGSKPLPKINGGVLFRYGLNTTLLNLEKYYKREEDITMNPKSIVLLLMIVFLVPGFAVAGGVTEEDFRADTTEQLLNLCTASPDDPYYREAIGFCHGYLVGAVDYYEAAHMGAGGPKLFCFPDPPPSRSNAISVFIEWAKAHPEYGQKSPVNTEFRFLTEKWPCK